MVYQTDVIISAEHTIFCYVLWWISFPDGATSSFIMLATVYINIILNMDFSFMQFCVSEARLWLVVFKFVAFCFYLCYSSHFWYQQFPDINFVLIL